MKRQVLWSALAAGLLIPGVGEGQAAAGFRAGVRSGTLETTQGVNAVSKPVYGAYLGFGLTDNLAFQMEAVYGTRGASGLGLGTDVLDPAATPVELAMGYLEVPLMLRLGFPAGWLLPSVFAGPYAGFVVSCDVSPDGGSRTSCDDETATQRFAPRGADVGVVAGAGLDISLGRATLFVDARYSLGLLSIQEGGDAFDARHSGIAVAGGFAVPLGR